jgi:nitrate reductase delta subunit
MMNNEPIYEPHSTAARVLAALLSYPDAQLRALLPELAITLLGDTALSAERRAAVFALTADLQHSDPLEAERSTAAAARRSICSSMCMAIRVSAARR